MEARLVFGIRDFNLLDARLQLNFICFSIVNNFEILARKLRSCILNESNDDDVTIDDAAKGVNHRPHDCGAEHGESSRTTTASSSSHHKNIVLASPFHGVFYPLKESISL